MVGCPRSGTTLLQNLLLTNTSVFSFPESHFFVNLFKKRRNIEKKLGLASTYSRLNFENFLLELDCQGINKKLPRHVVTLRHHTKIFIKTLDTITQQNGKNYWVEKTPDHVNFIDFIEANVQDTSFIHIIRSGPEVVASLYEVTSKYPEIWEGPWDIDRCIRKWETCVKSTLKHLNKPNHILVKYEALVNNSEAVANSLNDFFGVDFDWKSIAKKDLSIRDFIAKDEPWKAQSFEPISKRNTGKFHKIFDLEQQDYIIKKITEKGLINHCEGYK